LYPARAAPDFFASTNVFATTKRQSAGIGVCRRRSGSNSMSAALPGFAPKQIAWSMPPLCVPT